MAGRSERNGLRYAIDRTVTVVEGKGNVKPVKETCQSKLAGPPSATALPHAFWVR